MSRGVLVLARTKKPKNNLSIIRNKTTTTFPKVLEDTAYYMTKLNYGNLYRIYTKSCEEEVCENLEDSIHQYRKSSILQIRKKDTLFDQSVGFCNTDGNFISSRWSGDSHTFAIKFINLLTQEKEEESSEIIEDVEEDKPVLDNTDDVF